MSIESISTEDFFSGFDAEDGYQTAPETAEETETAEGGDAAAEAEEVAQEGAEGAESDETAGGSDDSTEETKEPEKAPEAETFTLKVNKAEHTVSRDEVIALAQKGMDYDRIKEAAERAKSDNAALNEEVAKMREVYSLIERLAEESKVTVPELMRAFRLNRLKGQGLSEDAATERLAREDAERELQTLKAKEQAATESTEDRAKREIAQFRQEYPDVEITKELIGALMDDVQGGKTFAEAYRIYDSKQKSAEIQRLRAQLEAEKQNKANRSSSPGSQNDSGASRTKSRTDAFFDAFN